MANRITNDCIVCGACEDACPTGAIGLGEGIFIIDPERCTECVGHDERCRCMVLCPIDCCVPDPEHRETEQELFARAQRLKAAGGASLQLSAATSHFRTD
jgi:ferredoxin